METTHYYFTPREMDSRSGKGPGTHDHDSALCGYGSYHFKRTKVKADVDCPACCARLGQPLPEQKGLSFNPRAAAVFKCPNKKGEAQ